MTAPLPNTRTVCVVSEKGSRLSPPATVRAPFTVTGISAATGCGLAPASALAAVLLCPAISVSLVSGAIAFCLPCQIFWRPPGVEVEQSSAPPVLYRLLVRERGDDSTQVLRWKHCTHVQAKRFGFR